MSCLDGPGLRPGEVGLRMDMSKGLSAALDDVLQRAATGEMREGDIVCDPDGTERVIGGPGANLSKRERKVIADLRKYGLIE